MNFLAVDDENLALRALVSALNRAAPEDEVYAFRSPEEALELACRMKLDAAFLDISMRGMTGLELARALKAKQENINIVLVTGYSEYAMDALSIFVSGYVMKPVTAEKIAEQLGNLRHSVYEKPDFRVRVQCFGNFEVFVDDKPVKFQYSKTKELFAYLIDRNGALCSGAEIAAALWEDDAGDKLYYYRRIRSDLISTLAQYRCEDCIVHQRGVIGVAADKLRCDYYDWLAGKPEAVRAYHSEYLSQYSWGEQTLGQLENSLEK